MKDLPRKPADSHVQALYRGCLLGGAVGDALGAPVEFMSSAEIAKTFGAGGIQEYVPAYGRLGAITDDTQMTLFTAEGVLRAYIRQNLRGICHPPTVIAFAYQRWLHSQGRTHALQEGRVDGWLIGHKELYSRRGPGSTCLSGLGAMKDGGDLANNDSKGCGGVMRVAPVGMAFATLARPSRSGRAQLRRDAFELGCTSAAITHGHPTGQLASGAFAVIVMQLLLGVTLPKAISGVLSLLASQPKNDETTTAIQLAVRLAKARPGDSHTLAELGGGWIAEEALAISLYCALSAKDFRSGVTLAVNHSGDSDSTGSMAGQLLGAMYGVDRIPDSWLTQLELRGVIEEIADDLAVFTDWRLNDDEAVEEEDFYFQRYPGA